MPSTISALISLLIFTLLPGISLIHIRTNVFSQLGGAIAFSIALNSLVLMLLTLFRAYTYFSAAIWIILLLLITAIIRRNRCWISSQFNFSNNPPSSLKDTVLLFPILAIVAYKSFFLPFYSWDAIASWNRWAREFAIDPTFFYSTDFFYPQYLSLGMSFPYVLSGNTSIEIASHGLSFFYFLILWTGVTRLCSFFAVPGAMGCTAIMIVGAVSGYSGTGYSDIAATGFSCLSIALILEVFKSNKLATNTALWRVSRNQAILAGLAAGTSFHYKISAPLSFGILILALVLLGGRNGFFRRFNLFLISSLSFLALVVVWVIPTNTALTPPLFHYVTTGIHGDISRMAVIFKGAKALVLDATAFNVFLVDIIVLLGACIFFIFALKKNSYAAILAISVLTGIFVWMGTANYDTRALMPFQIPAVIITLCGLIYFLQERFKKAFLPLIFLCLQCFFLLLYLIPQLSPELKLGENNLIDWAPGRNWTKTLGLLHREEQLRILRPALADLELWKRDHPRFSGTFWTDPLLVSSFNSTKSLSVARWLNKIESDGQANWKKGDYLVTTPEENDAPKLSFPILDKIVGISPTKWGPWINSALKSGVLVDESTYPSFRSLRFLEGPPKNDP